MVADEPDWVARELDAALRGLPLAGDSPPDGPSSDAVVLWASAFADKTLIWS